MIEKVNPSHPDKVADRIAGAIVDLTYKKNPANPMVAVEVLIGHGRISIISETSDPLAGKDILAIVSRITGMADFDLDFKQVPQDPELAGNQAEKIRAGDNGIFKGVPIAEETAILGQVARRIYRQFSTDGKYIMDGSRLIICQSNADHDAIAEAAGDHYDLTINPLGPWTGGTDVDTGAVNRKLGSDMAEAVTGGGLHGKDLSKADVSVNIYAHLKAQETGEVVNIACAIGDEIVDGRPYQEIVDIAKNYLEVIGGFEKLAEWGLV